MFEGFMWWKLWINLPWKLKKVCIYEGLQPIVAVSTVYPSSLRALRSQKRFRKVTQATASIYQLPNRSELLLASFFLRSNFWLSKTVKPKGKTVETLTTVCSPSSMLRWLSSRWTVLSLPMNWVISIRVCLRHRYMRLWRQLKGS